MAETKLSVLDYETKLAFRRRTKEGWVPGLPRRKHTFEYADYGKDGELLTTLLSGIDDIKRPFADSAVTQHYIILLCIPVRDQADALVMRIGTALWPGGRSTTPTFIDPNCELDFSIEEHREKYRPLSDGPECRLTFTVSETCSSRWQWQRSSGTEKIRIGISTGAFKVTELLADGRRTKDNKPKRKPQLTEDGSNDDPPRNIMQIASKGSTGTVKRKRRQDTTQRGLADFQANEKFQDVETRFTVSAIAQQSLSLVEGSKRQKGALQQPGSSNQIVLSSTLSLPEQLLKRSRRQNLEGQTSHNDRNSYPVNLLSTAPKRSTHFHKPPEIEARIIATSLETPIPPQSGLGQECTRRPPVLTSTAVPLDRRSNDVSHLEKSSLDIPLGNTDVRLCFGEVDHVIMYLDGCHTLTNLFANVRLHLKEEIGNKQISYIEVAQDCDQEFLVKRKLLKRLRLLPGSGRERTYESFLSVLESPEGENSSFKMIVHVKDDR